MKTTLITSIFFLALTTQVFSQKIKTSSSIELGWTDFAYSIYHNREDADGNHYESEKNSFYANIDLGVTFFKYFTIDNELETFFSFLNGQTSFNPYFVNYTIDFNAHYKFVQLGYKHQCIHPILNTSNTFKSEMYGGYDKIYVKFTLH
jgi:hypothetical protein